MSIDNLPEDFYADAIDYVLNEIEKSRSSHHLTWVANQLGIDPGALSRARNKDNRGRKFARMTRLELLKKITNIGGHNFDVDFDNNLSKIIVMPAISKTIEGQKVNTQNIYKVYYWRDSTVQVGVGIMIIATNAGSWFQATMLIDNQYPDFKNDDPYVLVSTGISFYEKNTYVDFIDKTAGLSGLRQLAIFHTPGTDKNKRPIVEGVFATLTREHKPIAGIMLMELLTSEEEDDFLEAATKDNERTFTHRRLFLQRIHRIPPVFYNALYRKRLNTKGHDLVSRKALPNYASWDRLNQLAGIYEGHHIRAPKNVVQCFLLEFHTNGSATLHFPKSEPGKAREPVDGQFKWVSEPKNTLTASFDYNEKEDHWRFRFILDGDEEAKCLYGIFAGTDVRTGSPVCGRVRLRFIPQEVPVDTKLKRAPRPRLITDYYDRLRQVDLLSQAYFDLLESDPGLKEFLAGEKRPEYTDWFHPGESVAQRTPPIQTDKGRSDRPPFIYAGDYQLYTLYRAKYGSVQKYFVLRHPVRIAADQSVLVKIRYGFTVSGFAIHQTPVLKINFAEEVTSYSHLLLTVNQLAYQKIDHVYGVLTGVHIENHRSEATIAVLVGNYSIKLEAQASLTGSKAQQRGINFDTDDYQEYEVGKADFFALDSGDPAKLATFIAGHFNRYISPPSHPNLEMQSRLSKYRLPYFKAACYAGINFNTALRESTKSEGSVPLGQVKEEYDLFIEAMEEAFSHGFCDPSPQQNNSVLDRPLPTDDVGMLLKEMVQDGSMGRLVEDILTLSDRWNRPQIRIAYEASLKKR